MDLILYLARTVSRPGVTRCCWFRNTSCIHRRRIGNRTTIISWRMIPHFFTKCRCSIKSTWRRRISYLSESRRDLPVRRKPEAAPRPHPPYTDGASFINAYGDETGNPAAKRLDHARNMELECDVLADELLSSPSGYGFDQIRAFAVSASARRSRFWPPFRTSSIVPKDQPTECPTRHQYITLIFD